MNWNWCLKIKLICGYFHCAKKKIPGNSERQRNIFVFQSSLNTGRDAERSPNYNGIC